MRSLISFILLTTFTLCLGQQAHQPLNLWPADAGKVAEEKVVTGKGDSVKRITDIHQASITPFRVAVPPDSIHPAVLVFPGGGYSILAIDKEGTEIAAWLNRFGFHLFETGGHGYGLRPSANEVSKWPAPAEEWLRSKR